MAYDRDSDPDSKDSKVPAKGGPESKGEHAGNEVEAEAASGSEASTESSSESPDSREAKGSRADSKPSKTSPSRTSSPKGRSASYEDDDEDDDDEDDDEEEEEERRPVRRRPPKRRMAKPRRKLDVPTTEEQLNIPKIQTIGMLGSISLLMIIMWFAARLACNAHPDQIRDPRYVSVDQLARDPKNAALEFQLRYVGKDYLLAGEIVTGKMADKIHELLSACEGNVEGCDKERLALKDKVTGTAALLDMSPARATVEVTTYVNNENPQTVTLDVVPSGQVWKVAQSREGSTRKPDAGTPGVEVTEAPLPAQ